MKDYEIVQAMTEGSYSNRYSKVFEMVISVINNKNLDILNFEAVKKRVEESMKAIEMKIRFDSLNSKVNDKLICNKTDFELDGHKLDSLDEVEKAINNKAFL